MKDRVSTYPGRVTLTPVSGQANTYDLVRADSPTEQGTPLNKANLLTDATAAALMGVSLYSEDMTVNQAFLNSIYRLTNCFSWKKSIAIYTESMSRFNAVATDYVKYGTGASPNIVTVQYASTVSVNPSTGAISLNSPVTANITTSNVATIRGKYFKITALPSATVTYDGNLNTTDVYYWDSSAGYVNVSAGSYTAIGIKVEKVMKVTPSYGAGELVEFLFSTNSSEYPNPNGKSGSYYYEFLGVPLDSVRSGLQIEEGTYIGTGTNRTATAPQEISFIRKPVIVFIRKAFTSSLQSAMYEYLIPIYGETLKGGAFTEIAYDRWGTNYLYFRLDGTTLSYYSENTGSPSAYDLNENNVMYHYIAITRG